MGPPRADPSPLNADQIRLLTVQQPWAWAIMNLGKDVENRTWRFWLPLGTTIGIHAGKRTDHEALDIFTRVHGMHDLTRGAVLGFADVVECVDGSPSVWAEPGYYHWVLANVRPLPEPVTARGAQTLFRPSPDVAALLHTRVGRRRTRAGRSSSAGRTATTG